MAETGYDLSRDSRRVDPDVARLIGRLKGRLVVIGSVARGNKRPADLDIWVNCDGFEKGESRYDIVRDIIAESGLPFSSCFPTSWTFNLGDIQVELIGLNNVDASFSAVKRAATRRTVFGVELPVAKPEHAGEPTKG